MRVQTINFGVLLVVLHLFFYTHPHGLALSVETLEESAEQKDDDIIKKIDGVKERLSLSHQVEDITGEIDPIRRTDLRVGVDYRLNARNYLGFEVSKQFYDRSDAQAWNRSNEDIDEAQIKYKISL